MKFSCNREALLEAVSHAASAATGQRPHLLMEIDGDHVIVEAASSYLSIVRRLPCETAEDGAAVVPGHRLAEVLASLSDAGTEAALAGEQLLISGTGYEVGLPALTPNADWENRRSLLDDLGDPVPLPDAELLVAALAQVVCAAPDTVSPTLPPQAVQLCPHNGALRIAATDSYRLAVRECPAPDGSLQDALLLPRDAAIQISRLPAGSEPAAARIGPTWVAIDIGPNTVAAQPPAGNFPDYGPLLDYTHITRSTADRAALLEALDRIGAAIDQAHHEVCLELAPGLIRISATAEGSITASATAAANHTGPPLTAAYDIDYLRDGIEHLPGSEAVLAAAEPENPLRISGPDPDGGAYLLMPLRR